MERNKQLALVAVGFFLSGCTGMTKNQAAVFGAATCGIVGGAAGASVGNNVGDRSDLNLGIGAGVGALTGALICGSLAYFLTEEPKPPPPTPPPPAPKVERTIILDDVLFDFDKSNVKPEAAAILDRLVVFMNENKGSKANLSGHTDSVGTEAYNQRLSERRVNSVRDYVVKKGVDSRWL